MPSILTLKMMFKASDPFKNLQKEASGIEKNEVIWQQAESVKLTKQTALECYKELAEKIEFPDELYFTKLKKAMLVWASLF